MDPRHLTYLQSIRSHQTRAYKMPDLEYHQLVKSRRSDKSISPSTNAHCSSDLTSFSNLCIQDSELSAYLSCGIPHLLIILLSPFVKEKIAVVRRRLIHVKRLAEKIDPSKLLN